MSLAELLDSAAGALDSKLADEPLVEASMLGLVADTDVGLGRYPQALAASDRQMALLQKNGGSDLEIGRALTARGRVLREQGRWQTEVTVMRQAVDLLRPLNAKPELAGALFELAAALSHTDAEKEAEADYQEELAVEAAGPLELRNHRSYTYYALAGLLTSLARYTEALQYDLKAIELAQRTMPRDHQDLLTFEAQYASTLLSDNQPAKAEAVLRDVIDRDKQVSGPNHKDVLLIQSLLADALVELERDDEAAQLARQAATGLDTLLGSDNSYALSAWQTFAIASCNAGDWTRGLEVAQRVSAARLRLHPAADRFVQAAAAAVGLCLYRGHRYAEAEPILLGAAAGLEAARGRHYRFTQITYRVLRDLYNDTGRAQNALTYSARLLH
jgi:serine/threonine-protein kinase